MNKGFAPVLILIITFLVFGVAGAVIIVSNRSSNQNVIESIVDTVSSSKPVSIPSEILNNPFGFPSGGPEDVDIFEQFGVKWVRPHPGPFQWGEMQKSANSEIDFSTTDKFIKGYQNAEFGTQVTLWPFADWDQESLDNPNCLVSSTDIMYRPPDDPSKIDYTKDGLENLKNKVFGEKDFKLGSGLSEPSEPHFLPLSRCNPHDWEGYLNWIKAVVERYDGDAIDDMPGLTIPVKYWEVLNEPDLNASHLDFYQGTPSDYAQLLIKTSAAIKEADPEAKVLIAGAAGGSKYFLDFYRGVFKNKDARNAFDIGNVHCISNDDYESFNAAPYKRMLAEFGIDLPIWVTEAETLISDNVDINASQTYASTIKAFESGAERIFYTGQMFVRGPDKPGLPEDIKLSDFKTQLNGNDPVKAFEAITSLAP